MVAAHPDDEVLGMGGTIAVHATVRADAVRIVCLTDGSSTQYPGDAEKRAQKDSEAVRAAQRSASTTTCTSTYRTCASTRSRTPS